MLLPRDGTPANATPHRRSWCYPGSRPRDGWEAASLEQNSQSGPIKAAAFAGLEHGGDDAWDGERAADPLPVPGLTPNLAGILRRPSRSRQGLTDSLFQGGGYRRPPEAFSCIPESRKAGTESFLNHRRHSPLHPRPAATPCSKGLAAARRLIVGALTLSSLAMSACVSPWAMRCNASAR